jgi:hypothetical protein
MYVGTSDVLLCGGAELKYSLASISCVLRDLITDSFD